MMRYKGESLHTLDVNVWGIRLMDSRPVEIDKEFDEDVEGGKFISEE